MTVFLFSEEYDFRNIRWGMSIEKVKASEDLEIVFEIIIKDDEPFADYGIDYMIYYKVKVLDTDIFLSYYFSKDKLSIATYTFPDDNQHEAIIELLIYKYGLPTNKDLKLADYQIYSWFMETTVISLSVLSLDRSKVSHLVYYSTKIFNKILEVLAKDKKEAADQF